MKSIFLIGDSISLYYHKYLKEILNDEAYYSRKGNEDEIKSALNTPNNPYGANGGDSELVVSYMENMVENGKKYDLLLVNCGLHDIRIDRENLKRQISEEKYKQNLEKIVKLALKITNKLIWINTTHVNNKIHNSREYGYLRFNEDVIKYNEIANEIMNKSNIEIIDLYKFTKSIEGDDMYKDHVHFKDNISKKQAKYIYDNIKKYI